MKKIYLLVVLLMSITVLVPATVYGFDNAYHRGYDMATLECSNEVSKLKTEFNLKLTELDTKYPVKYKRATYKEIIDFLAVDDTNLITEGNCMDFTRTLLSRAHSRFFASYPVVVNFKYGGAHAFVAFDTSDKGMVFIEPQTDEIVQNKVVVVGGDYSSYLCKTGSVSCMAKSIISQVGIFK
jgi:hypothetical protein